MPQIALRQLEPIEVIIVFRCKNKNLSMLYSCANTNRKSLRRTFFSNYFSIQQFSSNVTRTSSHGISFSSRHSQRTVGGSRSNILPPGGKWNVTAESKSEKAVTHHRPAVQVRHTVLVTLEEFFGHIKLKRHTTK